MGVEWPASFDWNRARAFLAAAEEGSFSAAARRIGSTQPTVGRQVAALEAELDVTLFERVGRGLALTPTGLELVEHVRAMAEAALRVSRVATGQALSLDGPIVISAGELIAAHWLPPLVARVRAEHPGITVEIVATNDVSDLGRREADIAIRSFRPKQADLVARKVRDDEARLYATPGYLASLGEPSTPAELSRADFIAFDRTEMLMEGLNALGLALTPASFPWVSANQHVQWGLVTEGVGVGIMLASIGDADPRVRRALPELPPIPVPTWLTSHREVRTSRRVRVVYDLLAEGLREMAPTLPLG
ncbi:MAG TPA: LysR family transcriptional regulator [Polyangiaceae bacterium LLY-WYZ-15_(1-7)]|nr:LysR family transcriptional regulator [Polyangiaceae bacterium LLY-WYZ-15_(1-7)]HJL08479.1 LysR family transcriptional regulator [Polyangiaceae bacterium LLY-WYZ-15_(1-7)]HJL34303.1 LysR family transcriptional regulator [Polyangiaceae bacterium LLY-WYZ-15_(1-7)]HJL46562.1 LysR family transcriptional regulator [Polyangiaceae bacterium LLY-WYZ-15_(1-7)]